MIRIEAKLTKDFSIDVKFFDAPLKGAQLSILYYGIIRAMKEHHEEAFTFAMDKFISEEIDEMIGDDEDDQRKS